MSNETPAEQAQPAAERPREKVSAFVIAFNEEEHIKDCLESLKFCDEIVVIDSFSTDRTVEIAKECGAQVIQRAWAGYRDQKAFGLASIHHEWVLNLDADERVSPELRQSIIRVLEDAYDGQVDFAGYYVNRVVYYLGRWWRRGGWYPEYRLRFFLKSRTVWGGIEPHEKPIVDGATQRLDGEIYHFTYRSMDEQFQQLHRFSTISAQEEFAQGRSTNPFQLIINPAMRVLKFYLLKRGYKEGVAGLIVAMTEGYYVFMKYAKLWELHFNRSRKKDA